jgi:hypothetical protein
MGQTAALISPATITESGLENRIFGVILASQRTRFQRKTPDARRRTEIRRLDPAELLHGYSGMPCFRHVADLVPLEFHHVHMIGLHALARAGTWASGALVLLILRRVLCETAQSNARFFHFGPVQIGRNGAMSKRLRGRMKDELGW